MEEWKKYIVDGENFEISAKIDRIEVLDDKVKIIDYKTGKLPSKRDILNGEKLQLSVEALILYKNNFNVEGLQYWKIKSDKYETSLEVEANNIKKLLKNTEDLILKLINFFNSGLNGYTATGRNKEYSDYNVLSRIDEWLYE